MNMVSISFVQLEVFSENQRYFKALYVLYLKGSDLSNM